MYQYILILIVCIIIFAWYYTSYDQVIGVAPESDEYKDVYYIYIYPKQNINNHTPWCEDILLNGPNKIGLLIPKDSSISDMELYYKQFNDAFRHPTKRFKFQDTPTKAQKDWCKEHGVKISTKKLLNHTTFLK